MIIMPMRQSAQRIKGLGFVLWHARHEFYHVLLGLVWAWFLREWWNEFNVRWIWWALFASLLPDADHVLYFFLYGRKDWYAREIRNLLWSRQWRNLATFIENGHKSNTSLATHNIYFILLFFGFAAISLSIELRVGVIFFGAMIIHYVFDIVDDLLSLGRVNPNWKRLKRIKARGQ
ncbi:metal-dependent hydrolase [Candidatus Gottesmanbacteria bacterium]|nr:metal-dependent hydrolase [Candidatus Gottesmanbacteria bacterium]